MRRTTSALVVAALLALLASPSLHAHPVQGSGKPVTALRAGAPDASLFADRDRDRGPHDPDLCPICRATAQARLALRAPVRAVPLSMTGASLPLPLAAPPAPALAPLLSCGAPRAPPIRLAALEA